MKVRNFGFLVLFLLKEVSPTQVGATGVQAIPRLYEWYAGSETATPDSIPSYRIDEVIVTGKRRDDEKKSATPFQILDQSALKEVNSLQVSDAVKFFSGATVKDFGGIGGMKTVSVRSMGAHHTAVAYDGVTITDCQTGQVDIGRYSLDNVEMLSLNIGDGNSIFQPARMFASSGLLTIQTRRPDFGPGETFHGKAGLSLGSFGLWNPSLLLDKKLSPGFDLSFSGEGLMSGGNYPYRLYYADAPGAFTREIRENNGVRTIRLESTLFGRFREDRRLEMKAYCYASERGLPGAVILYNPYSSQRLWDKNAFFQVHYEQKMSSRTDFQLNGKYNWSYQRYLNADYLGSSGKEDNAYRQDESYLSSTFLFRAGHGLSLALATDGALNRMQSDLYGFASPLRFTALANLSVKYANDWLLATAGVLGTAVGEERKAAAAAADFQRLSPAFSVSVKPFLGEEFRFRMFYKASFRMPSFNDLYYSAIGNRNLKPEESRQLDLGLTYSASLGKKGPWLLIASDVYRNRISNKIMAIPTKNIFIWSMLNLGMVDIQGLDFSLSASQTLGKDYKLSAGLTHTYLRALDVTDASAREYKNQIAYTPRISGSARLSLETPWVKVAYAMIHSGHRYVTGQNLRENDLPGYSDHSVSADRTFRWNGKSLNIRAEMLNLLNENYEIVRNFPMPGRSYRMGVKLEF